MQRIAALLLSACLVTAFGLHGLVHGDAGEAHCAVLHVGAPQASAAPALCSVPESGAERVLPSAQAPASAVCRTSPARAPPASV